MCFPVSVVQKLLIAGKQKQVMDSLVTILSFRIAEKEAIIKDLKQKDSANTNIIHTYENQISLMKDQRTVFEDQIKSLNKQLKKERRRTRWTSIAGITLTGIITYLYIIK